jgi:hypothetical protein
VNKFLGQNYEPKTVSILDLYQCWGQKEALYIETKYFVKMIFWNLPTNAKQTMPLWK